MERIKITLCAHIEEVIRILCLQKLLTILSEGTKTMQLKASHDNFPTFISAEK